MPKSKNPIEKTTCDGAVILVEGKDDKLLVDNLITANKPNIIDMNGYPNLNNILKNIELNTKEFKDKITHLLIIIDADENCAQRKREVLGKLKKVGIKMPDTYQPGNIEKVNGIKIGIYILPDNNNDGSLEALLLQSVRHQEVLACAEEMINCWKAHSGEFWKTQNQRNKIKHRLYMNALVGDHEFNYTDTLKSEIDYSNTCFDSLKQFLNAT